MTMDSMELPSISSTTSISDNPALKNYYEKLLFKNGSNKSLTDFQHEFNPNNDNSTFDKNDITNRVDFIKGFNHNDNNHDHTTNSTSTSTSSTTIATTNHSPLIGNEHFSPLTKLDSQQQFENVDPKKRVSKVTFPSLQIIPNESESNSMEPTSNYDISMFQSAGLPYERSNIISNNIVKSGSQSNGRRKSIFNFSEINKKSNNNIGIIVNSSNSNATTTSNGQPVLTFNNFNFNGTSNHVNSNNTTTTNIAAANNSNTMNSNITSAGDLFLPNKQTLFASERRSSYISDSLIHHNYGNNNSISNYHNIDPNMVNNSGLLNNYHFNSQNDYTQMIPNRNNSNLIQNNPNLNYYDQLNNNSNSIATLQRSNDNGLLPQSVCLRSPATLLSQMFNNTNNINPSDTKLHTNGYPYSKLSNMPSQNERYVTTMQQTYNNIGSMNTDFTNPIMNNYNNQRRNTQPALFSMNGNKNTNGNSKKNNQYGYLNYLNNTRYVNASSTNNNNNITTNSNNNMNHNNDNNSNNQDNGLILLNTRQLTSSSELQKIYEECGKNYFSSEQVYNFGDYIKGLLNIDSNNNDKNKDSEYMTIKKSVSKFLSFLKSCNLSYNSQSDTFISKSSTNTTANNNNNNAVSTNGGKRLFNASIQNNTNSNNNSTSTYLHYKPLVLVSLKNGKLELLSIPSNSNLLIKRGDLIIIDGDRGKDLALVVEPVINLDMALMINFLKKKIHFDSLITNRDQHYPNSKFINALVNATQGLTDELDPKLYDVIELIQLVVPSKQIVRFATPWEVSSNLHNKFQDELKALHIAQLKLKSLNNHDSPSSSSATNSNNANNSTAVEANSNSTKLNIKILNAEFQFDRKKLTFYYICEERNDFRELIKELFKFYKTRIWLCAIPNNLNIDKLYCDNQQHKLKMYQEMTPHYINDDLSDTNLQQNGSSRFFAAPALNQLKLDDFQIGVYKELVKALFSSPSS